jgi:hypothetical protein
MGAGKGCKMMCDQRRLLGTRALTTATLTHDIHAISYFYFSIIIIIIIKVAIPVTGPGGPYRYETSRFPHFLDNLLTDDSEVVSLTCRQPLTPL